MRRRDVAIPDHWQIYDPIIQEILYPLLLYLVANIRYKWFEYATRGDGILYLPPTNGPYEYKLVLYHSCHYNIIWKTSETLCEPWM